MPWRRFVLATVLGVGVYELLAWLPDHDASDAHLWALIVAEIVMGVVVFWPERS